MGMKMKDVKMGMRPLIKVSKLFIFADNLTILKLSPYLNIKSMLVSELCNFI